MQIQKVTKLACDFCGKDEDEVEKMIAGPRNVAICDECIALCVEIISGRIAGAGPVSESVREEG